MIFREVEDRDLIAKAQQGNVEAYNLLVSRWDEAVPGEIRVSFAA